MKRAILALTRRIAERSAPTRGAYLARIERLAQRAPGAERMGCANVAHAFAVLSAKDKLTPPLAVLQGKGFQVALVTDGRMSGASGKVQAAIHVSPEALAGGALARVRDGDVIRVDAVAATLAALVPEAQWASRAPAVIGEAEAEANGHDLGRELFAGMRRNVRSAEEGAITRM